MNLLPVHVKPPPTFPHKPADLVHAVSTSLELVTGDKFHCGMVDILLLMRYYLQAYPLSLG